MIKPAARSQTQSLKTGQWLQNKQFAKLFKKLHKSLSFTGRFQWYLAAFGASQVRDAVIQKLAKEYSRQQTVVSLSNMAEIYDFESMLVEAARQHSIVHIIDTNDAFALGDTAWPNYLNLSREGLAEKAPVNVVFWLSDAQVTFLAKKAPDFWNWRSGVLDFTAALTQVSEAQSAEFQTRSVPPQKTELRQQPPNLQRIRELIAYFTEREPESLSDADLLQELAKELLKKRDFKRAKTKILQSVEIFSSHKETFGHANALCVLAEIEMWLQAFESSLTYYHEAIALYKSSRSSSGLANALISLADLELRLGQLERCRARYHEAIGLYQSEKDNLGLANGLRSLADLERRLGELDSSRTHYHEAIGFYQSEKDYLGLANALETLADLERRLGALDSSRAHYHEAITLFQSEKANLGLANALRSLANLEGQQGELDSGRARYQEAIALYQSEKYNLGLANAFSSLADLELRMGELDNSWARYQEAIKLFQSERDNLGLANTFWGLGDWHYRQSQFEAALTEYQKAIPLFHQEQEPVGLAICSAESLRCFKQLQNSDESEFQECAVNAMRSAKASNAPPVIEYVETVILQCLDNHQEKYAVFMQGINDDLQADIGHE